MPRQSHYRRSVKFFDESQASETDHHQIQTAASTRTDQNISSKYEGPRFPNLHMMFKHKETATTQQDHHPVVIERSVETVEKTRSHEEKNIDMEADEYIKRKHQSYYQRLMTMDVA
ncbi:uncharacterized protein A4U43_C09F16240 [Asparagus officinalis]|uniref:Uncharacterized protein n=1 Tax=Asparagus officinalis TaxID=4686 RepID=A0A5P1EBA2_ASPOF|nr:uncharacterized protein A4U43_C09F16240 [Asparagus officinalis]